MFAGCGGSPANSAGSVAPTTTTGAASPAKPTPSTSLLALSKRDHTLAIVDPKSLEVIVKIPVGDDPHEVVASTDGTRAYVSNYGSGTLHTLAVVDLVHQTALPPIELGALTGPHGLVARGDKIWFTAEGAKAIGSYDPQTNKIGFILGTGQDRTHMIFVSADLKQIFTTNVSSATVSIIEKGRGHHGHPPPGMPGMNGPPPPNGSGAPPQGPPPQGGPGGPNFGGPPGRQGPPAGEWSETIVPVGQGSEGFDVTPDGDELWTANAQDGTISIVDLTTKTVSQTLNVDVKSANRLKFTVDGKRALVSRLGNGNVSVLDTKSRERVGEIAIGHGASGILMQPDGSRAYVACSPDNDIAVIDLQSLKVVGQINVGNDPDGLAWAVRR